jgi:hypothetical protein
VEEEEMTSSLSGPLILIVGSADLSRQDYDPKLVNPKAAPEAAEELGLELARRGCRIVVYSASEQYLERDVVRGFVGASKKNATKMIEVRYPYAAPGNAEFPEADSRKDLFDPTEDHRNASWEASFYASLRNADGVLVIGGGHSARAIGHMALAFQKPVAALACFGGAAQAIYRAILPGKDLASEEDLRAMNPATWKRELAPALVNALFAQRDALRLRAEAEETARRRRRATFSIVAAVCILMAAIAMTVLGFTLPDARANWLFTWLLFFVGPIAGAGSALASAGWRADDDGRSAVTTAGLGFVAGLISSLFYLLAQFSTANDTQSIKNVAIIVAMATGLVAGFTVDQVLKQAAAGRFRIAGQGGSSAVSG